jgi:Uncharacterized protein conserved in archaea, COG1698
LDIVLPFLYCVVNASPAVKRLNIEKKVKIFPLFAQGVLMELRNLALKKEKQSENLAKAMQAISIIQSVVDNNSIPRNIRKLAKEVVDSLKDEKLSIGVRAANAISTLEEISQDPNVPSFARVTLWNAVSVLEGIRE